MWKVSVGVVHHGDAVGRRHERRAAAPGDARLGADVPHAAGPRPRHALLVHPREHLAADAHGHVAVGLAEPKLAVRVPPVLGRREAALRERPGEQE